MYIMKTDIEIQEDVIEQLKWEPILNAAEIGVAVKHGIVTLSGVVDAYSKKRTAEIAVRKLSGVKAIVENIQVGFSPGFRKTDTEIAEAVLNALKWNSSVTDFQFKIKVEDGVVTVEGEVNWEYQRSAVRMAIEHLNGVRRINNLINIRSAVTPANVKQKILSAFHRSATIDADMISVELLDNRVVLRGKVRSFAEREDAVDAAWSAPGIRFVENRIIVEEEELVF
jgi:osmotically-inducible protein OsmY